MRLEQQSIDYSGTHRLSRRNPEKKERLKEGTIRVNKPIKLSRISEGMTLAFPKGEEIVIEIDRNFGNLYTLRTRQENGWTIKEKILYSAIEYVEPNSEGYIKQTEKRITIK